MSAGLKAISWIEVYAINGYWESYEPACGNANTNQLSQRILRRGRIAENAHFPKERNDPPIPSPFGHTRCQRWDGVNPVVQFIFRPKIFLLLNLVLNGTVTTNVVRIGRQERTQ